MKYLKLIFLKMMIALGLYNVSKRYEFGEIGNGVKARRCTATGRVDIRLWKAGEQGHKEDYYHKCGAGWEQTFNVC